MVLGMVRAQGHEDRRADVQIDCKNVSQETNASKIDIRDYKNCRKLKQPAQLGRHSD